MHFTLKNVRSRVRTDIFDTNADIGFDRSRTAVLCPLSGVKRTWLFAAQMSAFDPKRTSSTLGLPLPEDTQELLR
jgi:hypothetical protein